jgi:chitin synthase
MAADLKFQHKVYMFIVSFFNIGFVVSGAFFPLGTMNIIIVGLPHFRDLLYIFLRITFSRCKFVSWSTRSKKSMKAKEKVANVVAIIPAYKEDPEEVELTLASISSQIEKDHLHVAQVIVSDGFLDYHEIIDDLREIVRFPYTTYKREKNSCSIMVGYYKGVKVAVAKKRKNAGKKDSLVLTDDIFIKGDEHFGQVRDAILREFDMESCDYIFHTDADSVIGPNAFRRLVNALISNEKIAAVAGLVLVPFESFSGTGFWNFFQGFQYYYGQVVRKASESLWGKVTCLPGCITMVRAQHPAVVAACDRYNKLPSSNFIFQVKNRLQGTDRRYTNCVTQYSADTYLVVDMWSDCFTVPPQSMEHFRSQRKRWTSNAITGNWFLMLGTSVPWYTRCLCAVDIFRIHTSVTRFCCTIQFFYALIGVGATLTNLQIAMLALVIALPYCFFLSTIVTRGKYGAFLLAGSLISKVFSPFITIYIFVYAMLNFADLTWGKTHGSQSTDGAKKEVKEEGEVESIVFADRVAHESSTVVMGSDDCPTDDLLKVNTVYSWDDDTDMETIPLVASNV